MGPWQLLLPPWDPQASRGEGTRAIRALGCSSLPVSAHARDGAPLPSPDAVTYWGEDEALGRQVGAANPEARGQTSAAQKAQAGPGRKPPLDPARRQAVTVSSHHSASVTAGETRPG